MPRPRKPRPKPPSPRPIFGLVFGGIGLLLVLLAAVWAVPLDRLSRSGTRVLGRVIALEKRVSTDNKRRTHVSYQPRVRFTVEGKEAEIVGLGAPKPAYRPGDQVTVVYPAGHPDQAVIASFQELREGPITVGVAGLIFTAVGILLYFLRI